MAAALDIAHLKTWVGREETAEDVVAAWPAAAMTAALDRDDPPAPGDSLPPSWHWTLFLPHARASALGPDGHPARGGFLPPVKLPRRMWAGSRLEFPGVLRIGDAARRVSRIVSVEVKEGRSGPLVFVTARHEIAGPAGPAIVDEHDIVYRDAPRPGEATPEPPPAPGGADWSRPVAPDPVLLFRYSALTFNGHRIHYDRDYCKEVEGYPGLVVHGPLIATLLLDLVRRNLPAARVRRFSFRAVSPLFDVAPFTVNGRRDGSQAKLWAANATGSLAMTAEAEIAA